MQLKVMTYNIQSGRNLAGDRSIEHALRTIRAEMPDILTLNEVQHRTALSEGRCQAAGIAAALGYGHRFARAIDFMDGEYGIALLSRFPILSAEIFPVPELDPALRDGWYEPRVHLCCALEIEGRTLTVLSTHYGLSDGEIRLAVSESCRLSAGQGPLLLMGDLNAVPDSPLLAPLREQLADTDPAGASLTYPSDRPAQKIDYIFTRGNFTVQKVWAPASTDSDHRPLCAALDWE